MRKHLLSVLTALALFLTLFPAPDAQAALSSGASYALKEARVDGASVSVRLYADSDCALFVATYEESGKMQAVRTQSVVGKSDEQTISFAFDSAIGAGGYALAFLLDPATFAPLCARRDSRAPADDDFPVDQYALIERISIETVSVAGVITATSSVINAFVEIDNTIIGDNDATHQFAYNQGKTFSDGDPRAQLRFTNGTRRTVTLDDSKNYRTDVAGDAAANATITGTASHYTASADISLLTNHSGKGDGNWIAFPFTAGHIVRYSVSDGVYSLYSVIANEVRVTTGAFGIINGAIGSGDATNPLDVTYFSGATQRKIIADSETRFAIQDGDSWKTYVGAENVPDVVSSNGVTYTANAYIYHRDGIAKLIFVTDGEIHERASSLSDAGNELPILS